MPNLIKWYYLRQRSSGKFSYTFPCGRNMDKLFEWNSQKLIEWFISDKNIRLLRDLVASAARLGQLDLVKRIFDIFDEMKLGYAYTEWQGFITYDVVEAEEWDVLAYLLSKGFYMSGQGAQIMRGDVVKYTTYISLLDLHHVISGEAGNEFPED